jgi:hypothetical protein
MARLAVSLAGAAIGNFIAPGIGGQIGFALGSLVGNALFAPDLPPLIGPKIEDGKVSTSAYGGMLPIVWGTIDVAGNIIDAGPLDTEPHSSSQSAKGGPKQSSITYTQYMDYCVALCESCESIVKIFANEQLIYDVTPGSSASRPEWLDFTLYTGSETQLPDPTFEALYGVDNVPAYRGTAYVVFRRFRVTDFNTTAVSFRFVVTTNGTGSTGTTTYDQGGTGSAPSIIHNAHTDLMIGSIKRQITGGGTEQMLVAIDPYSSAEVWRSFIVDADVYGEAFWVTQCAFPDTDQIGARVYPNNSIIAVMHRKNVSDPQKRYLRFFYADSGLQFGIVTISTGESDFKVVSCYPDDAVFYQFRSIGAPATNSVHRHYITSSLAITTQTLEPPDGYSFDGASTNALWVAPGSLYGGTRAIVLVRLENDSTSAYGMGVFEDYTQGVGASVASVSWRDVDELSASSGDPVDAVYDPAEQCFFVLCMTNPGVDTVIARVSVDGTIESETDWLTDFSISGAASSITLDTTRDLLVVVIGGVAYTWPTYDATATPVAYGSSLQAQALQWHPYSGSLFAGRRSDTVDDVYYQYRLGQITGGGETLQSVVEDICDAPGTYLETGDRACTALSGITVDGFRLSTIAQRRAAIDALRSAYLFDFVPRAGVLTAILRGGSSAATFDEDDIGAHVDGGNAPVPLAILESAEDRLPKKVGVRFIDANQNYEVGYEHATRLASAGGTESTMDVAIVLSHNDAAQLASISLHAAHIEAERYEFAAMPSLRDTAVPAAVVTVSHDGGTYPMRLDTASIVEGGAIQCEGARHDASIYTDYTVGGTTRDRLRSVAAIGSTQLVTLDIPGLRDADLPAGYYVGGATYSPEWAGAQVFDSEDGVSYASVATLDSELTYGFLTAALPDGDETDLGNTLSVRLVSGSLASISDAVWQSSAVENYAAIGAHGRWELIHFQSASESAGVYTLSGLLRGARDTIGAKGSSVVGDKFILLDANAMRRVTMPETHISAARWLKAVTFGRSVDDAIAVAFTAGGRSLKPFRPTCLDAQLSGSDWVITWARQDRKQARFMQQPAMSEASESYSVQILDYSDAVIRTITASDETTTYTSAMQTTDFGGNISLIKFKVAQVSATVGAGPYVSGVAGSYTLDYDALVTARSELIDFWPLDETSGTTATSYSGTHNGTYVNGPTLDSTSLTLDGAPSVRMNTSGNDDYINYTPGAWSAAVRCVDFVIRPIAFSGNAQDQGIISASTGLGGGNGWAINFTQAGKLTFRSDPSNVYTGPDTEIISDTTFIVGNTYHVMVNFGPTIGDDVEIYIDGILDKAGNVVSTVVFPSTAYLRVSEMGQHLQSNIAKLGMYNANMTAYDAIIATISAKGLTL